MTPYEVHYLPGANHDLLDILAFLAEKESPERADDVLKQLTELCDSLEKLPYRGRMPPELQGLGRKKFLEVHFKPYRVIYQVIGRTVFIHGVFDGRRNMQSLLAQRLTRP